MIEVDVYADPALPILERAAEAVAYRFGPWIGLEDLFQEAYIWRLKHPILVATFLEPKEGPVQANGLQKVVAAYLTSVARKEKALSCGYHPDDECFYKPAVIAELLPLIFDLEAALLPSAPTDDAPGRGGNPHGQGDFVTSLLDVRGAWISTAFRNSEMRIIESHFVDGMEWAHIAASFGMDEEEVKKQAAIGLRRMSDALGGLPARECLATCECKAAVE